MTTRLTLSENLEAYADFINNESFADLKLSHYIADVQRVYCADKRPWVVGYSGGKDSSAVLTLVYLALLGLPADERHKPVFVVASDTLVETPTVISHIKNTLSTIEKGAKRDKLPISCHRVTPEESQTFWVKLLGRGYPAPSHSFRWCTELLKIDPVSDFINSKVSQYDEVIVVLGSRRQDIGARSQAIAKHRIERTRFARHTTLINAFIYTPIDTWAADDVWKILRLCHLEARETPTGTKRVWRNLYGLEWESPWGSKNLALWNLYKDSSNQNECPMVIDVTIPSCGNSRFGCWTCTVVSQDRALESLAQNGEEWMAPLLIFRDKLSAITKPEACNLQHKRLLLRELLELDKHFKDEGRGIDLITAPELHAIRQEWLNAPEEPDAEDSLPAIFNDVYGYELDWS